MKKQEIRGKRLGFLAHLQNDKESKNKLFFMNY